MQRIAARRRAAHSELEGRVCKAGVVDLDLHPPVLRLREGELVADCGLRARRGDYDAVLSMYHDQGQIALKLLGFERGVTILGGLPIPIATPAHGTAYDIQGKGVADPSATIQAFRTLVMLAQRQSAQAVA